VKFTFAALVAEQEAGQDDVQMSHFHLQVVSSSDDGVTAFDKVIRSARPQAEVSLRPGRYHWSVQWTSSQGELSSVASSEVVVADTDDAWAGVPWRGSNDVNEFMATIQPVNGSQVEMLVATLGFGYVTVNQQEISEDVLSYSGWTNTEKRVLYRQYDVTSLLRMNPKGLSIFVGLGCGYRCDAKGQTRFPHYRDKVNPNDSIPKIFRLLLRVNGKTVFHSGSDGWLSRQGAVVEDSVYDGEIYNPSAAGKWAAAAAPLPANGPRWTYGRSNVSWRSSHETRFSKVDQQGGRRVGG
jgi:hypothetical protein